MQHKRKYLVSILLAAFTFGLIPIFGQYLTNNGVSSFKQTFFMEAFAFIIIFPLYFFFLKVQRIKKKDILYFLLFGASLFLVNLNSIGSKEINLCEERDRLGELVKISSILNERDAPQSVCRGTCSSYILLLQICYCGLVNVTC